MIRKALIGWPHVLRATAVALAALSLTWGVAIAEGLIAAMLGAAAGSIAGQHLAKSKLRLGVILGGAAIALLLAWQVASLSVTTDLLPRLIGPGSTLRAAGCLRFGAVALTTAAAMRAVAARRPSAVALELAFVTIAITTVFAAHRDGIIARPLWLSDWAWRQAIDPAHILLGVGIFAAGVLAILLLIETRSGRPVSSLVALTALAIVAALGINALAMPQPDPMADLGLGDMPPTDTSTGPPRGGAPDAGSDDGGGTRPGLSPGDAGRPDASPGIALADGGGAPDGSTVPGIALPGQLPGGRGLPMPPPNGSGSPDASGNGGLPGDRDAGQNGGQSGGQDAGQSGGQDAGQDGGQSGGQDTAQNGGQGGGQDSDRQEGPTSGEQQLEQQEPGEDGTPPNAPALMAVVLLDNDYSPPSQAYYFREEALSQYNGVRLVKSSFPGADLDVPESFPVADAPVAEPPPSEGRDLVRTTVVLIAEHTKPFALESPRKLAPAPNPNPSRFSRAYRAESLAQSIDYKNLAGRAAGDSRWPPGLRAYYTEPPLDRRYHALARRIADALPPQRRADPFALAVAVKLHLDRALTYSTAARHTGAADPTADMLFGDRIGYCVHFAHAAVFLWRALGIPSRVSVGYHAEEDDRRGGSTILLRSGDAHAWPELYLEGVGWIVLDIAAAQNLDPPATPPDDELQRLLGEMARGEQPDPVDPPGQKSRLREIFRDIGKGAVALSATIAALLYLIKAWRRIAPWFSGPAAMPIVGYRCALDLLAEAGLVRRYGETREGFAARAREVAPSFEDLTWMHLAARLRAPDTGEPADRDERGETGAGARPELSAEAWRSTLASVRREIAARGGRLRRFLGALDPASFLDSR